MKKFLLTTRICICGLQLKAQDVIEFMGVPLCGSDTTEYCSVLREKGFVLFGDSGKSKMYKGLFSGMEASVMVVPFEGSSKATAIVLTLYDLNPVKGGTVYGEFLQKFLQKYQNMKYESHTDLKGSTTTTFSNDSGFVALKMDVADMGRSCQISVYYTYNGKNAVTKDGDGLSMDDI